jgi:hypothetical protein
MALPCVTTGRQDTPRLSCRRVCFASSLGSNSTDRAAADRSRSTRHIDDLSALRRLDPELS